MVFMEDSAYKWLFKDDTGNYNSGNSHALPYHVGVFLFRRCNLW